MDKLIYRVKAIAKSILILLLIILVMIMMYQIKKLQGTARVINYAGLVRGATQREVKLEITGNSDDALITYLDDILSGLRYEDGNYDLILLDDKDYQKKLDVQIACWEELKEEIQKVRTDGYLQTDIVDMSEDYFKLADETVSAAEDYSEEIAVHLRLLEIISAIIMVGLIGLIIEQTVTEVRIARTNKILEKKAYIDLHTGLPNKSRCEEMLHNVEFLKAPVACIVLDLNNLKHVNDTMGHSIGDQLIMNFARIIRNVVPAKDFVGRCGGDEFIVFVHEASRSETEEILGNLQNEVERFNCYGKNIKISYASGWALSSDYENCTLRTLFDKADQYMYEDKQRKKGLKR